MTATTFNPLATARSLEAAGIERRQVVSVSALLGAGADPDARDSDGDTALIFAASKGHSAVVSALLGAD